MLGCAFAVHLRNDERHAVLQTVRRRLVDRDRAAANGVGDEFPRRCCADGEQADVEVPGGECVGRRFLDEQPVDGRSSRARRRERANVLVAAFAQELQGNWPDRAGRADHSDARRPSQARTPRAGPGRRGRRPRSGRGMRS